MIKEFPLGDRDNEIFSTQFFDVNGNTIGLDDKIKYSKNGKDTYGYVLRMEVSSWYDPKTDSGKMMKYVVLRDIEDTSKLVYFSHDEMKDCLNISAEDEQMRNKKGAIIATSVMPSKIEECVLFDNDTNDDAFSLGLTKYK